MVGTTPPILVDLPSQISAWDHLRMSPDEWEVDVPFDLNLEEINFGPKIIFRGLAKSAPDDAVFCFDFEPPFAQDKDLWHLWDIESAFDELGTHYRSGSSGWGPEEDGLVHHGELSLDQGIPAEAETLIVTLYRFGVKRAAGDWVSGFTLDLRTGEVTSVKRTSPDPTAPDVERVPQRIPFVWHWKS
jgi:hypothetical protein